MPSARAATRSPLVLMADAHEWFSRALESVLVPGGYSVVKAYTATGLLQQLELTEPDALILAVDLPGGEGLNLCRRAVGPAARCRRAAAAARRADPGQGRRRPCLGRRPGGPRHPAVQRARRGAPGARTRGRGAAPQRAPGVRGVRRGRGGG